MKDYPKPHDGINSASTADYPPGMHSSKLMERQDIYVSLPTGSQGPHAISGMLLKASFCELNGRWLISSEDMERFLGEYAYTYGYYYDQAKHDAKAEERQKQDIQKYKKDTYVRLKSDKNKKHVYQVIGSYYEMYGGNPFTGKHKYDLRHCWDGDESAWHHEDDLIEVKGL